MPSDLPAGSGPGNGAGSAPGASEPTSTRAPRSADLGPASALVLVRHGRTAMTEQHRMAGGGGRFDPSLSPRGLDDAARARATVATVLSRHLGPSVVPDAVVASPMARTRETAAVIAQAYGLAVETDDGFRENDYGDWDGHTYGEVAARWPEELAAWQGSDRVAPPGGESLHDHVVRVLAARDRMLTERPGQVVVVVAHVTPIRAVLRDALDAALSAMWRIKVDPCSVSLVRHWADGQAEVGCANVVDP